MRFALRVLGCLVLFGNGCGTKAPIIVPRPSLLAVARRAPDYPSPARWRYHPRQAAAMLARESEGNASIFAGDRGERWRVKVGAEAAAHLAPEPLVSILRPEPSRWVFLGASGTAYEAEGPLGPFLRGAAPLDPLARVRAASSTLLGLRTDGGLVRSLDTGLSWVAVGPTRTRFSDLALLKDGTGLALAIPERLWKTGDYGQSWAPLDAPPMAALSFAEDSRGAIVIHGVLGYARYRPPSVLEQVRDIPEAPVFKLGVAPGRGPDAGAVAEGRAVVAAGHYYELERSREDSSDWRLWRGRAEDRLEAVSVPVARGCHTVRLAGHGERLIMSCWRQAPSSSTQPIEFFASDDRGRTWRPVSVGVWGRLSDFDLAMGRDGRVIATGICASRDSERGCRPYGVHTLGPARPSASAPGRRRPRGGPAHKLEFFPAATPAIGGSADAVTFSADGSIAYAVAPRRQGRSYALYVSRDRGRSFVAHELLALPGSGEASDDDDFEGFVRRRGGPAVAMAAAEDGTVSLVVRQGDALRLLVADQDGQVISVADPPAEASGLGAVGVRALAFSAGAGQVWESLDGGTSWDPIGRLPVSVCKGDGACRLPVVCHPGGCVMGDELSRIGWRGQSDSAPGLPPPPGRKTPEPLVRKVSTPMVCTLAAEPWKHVDGAELVPRADQAALGKVTWFAQTSDEDKGSFGVVHGFGGSRPRLERVMLLPPVAGSGGYARRLSLQAEGVAALRYRLPKAQDPRLLEVEVGWENLFEGRVKRVKVGDGGPYRPGDYEAGPGGSKQATPDLLSITEGGLYLRLHARAHGSQETLFMDGNQVTRVGPLVWPAVAGGSSIMEMVRAGGQHVPLLLVGNGTALVRARPQGRAWAFDALAIGLSQPAKFGLAQSQDIAYLGARAGLQITMRNAARTEYEVRFYAFRSSGAVLDPPIETPAQRDAGDRPRACTAAERISTPRVVMPLQAGSRHPILIADGTDPQRVFLTSDAVMHGTPREACIAAFDANQVEPTAGTEGQLESAIIALDDLEHAWLFRMAPADPKTSPGFDYRLMSCRFDSSVEVPNVVYEAPGTLIPR